jgi:hypothetical protein
MQAVVLSGIRPGFPGLSRSAGQIAHVLLTRSPLESPPKGHFPFDLHVLSTPPAFVLSQDQTLQTKTTHQSKQESTSEKSDQTTSQNWHKKQNHPHTGRRGVPHKDGQKNNKQKPPNTLLSSQTTHPFNRQPCHYTLGGQSRQSPSANRSDRGRGYVYEPTRSISAPRLTRFSTNSG